MARAFIRVQEEEGATVVGYTEEKSQKHSASKRTKASQKRKGDRPRPSRNSSSRKQRAHKRHRRHSHHRRQKGREERRQRHSSSCPSSPSSSSSYASSSSSVEGGEERHLTQKRRSPKSIGIDKNVGDDDATYHENVLRVVKENERLKQQLEEMKKRMELMSKYLRQQSTSKSPQASTLHRNQSNANTTYGGGWDGDVRLRTGKKRKSVGGGAGDSSSLDENVPVIDYTPFSEQSLEAMQAEQLEIERVRQRIHRRINEGRVYKGQIGFYPTEEEKEKQKKDPDYVDPSKPSAHDLYKAQKKEEREQGLGGMRYGLIKEDGDEDPNHEADVFHASQGRKMGQSVYQETMEKIRTERSERGTVRDRMDMGNQRALQDDVQARINGPIWGGSTSDYS